MLRFLPLLPALLLLLPPQRSLAQEPSAEQVRFFETSIRPVLAEHCYRCHGPQKQKGDLRLDSRERILKGSSAGPVVAAGQPESVLIKAVRHQDEELKMPPDKKLSDRQIADLVRWVKMGLPYPRDQAAAGKEDPRAFWAFRPALDPRAPAVKDTAWPRSDLDRFVLARLEEKNLKPAPPADRRALIRRVTFDLTGLPPTPQEVEAFLQDTSAGAFARVVDRLLASPHYGERWGRHWLDVVRYADSNGLDENVAFGNAWRYRDYVVAAFNQDKPYDQFLLEQLAGDLLPEDHGRSGLPSRTSATDERHTLPVGPGPARQAGPTKAGATRTERLIATGFLALGPKVLAEVDDKQMEMDIIDEQLDTFGRAVLGMTLGCARCHDHKFDPLTANDYYGLAGIFKSTKTMEHYKKIARWHENSLASVKEQEAKAASDKKVAATKSALKALTAKAKEQAQEEIKRLREELSSLEKSAPDPASAMGATEGTVTDVPIHVRGSHLKLGPVVPRHVPVVLAGTSPPAFDGKQSGRLELARWLIRPEHPLTARVMVNRIWRWHFGQGIVRTPDNFGKLGEAPDHPELLDWLAHRFVASGWSIKAMHRLILLSATYQQASAQTNPPAADPENRLLARAPVRRLEAEELRDALLAVSGRLDTTMGGSLLHVKNRQYLFDHTSKDATKYDSRRRSVYLPVIRNNVYDVFQLFDFPDPAVSSGDRPATTVAPQALFLMNSDWVAQLCEGLAEDLLKDAGDDAGRVRRLYQRAYARPATEQETTRGLALVCDVETALAGREPNAGRRRTQAWACLCQTVVSANEFVYLD